MVSRTDAGIEGESLGLVLRIVTPDVQVGIIRTRGKKPSAC